MCFKALRAAIERVFGSEVAVQRCQLHKRRNVKDHLPKEHREAIDRRIRAAYNMACYEDASRSLELTIGHLERLNPSAAGSLKEGMEETLIRKLTRQVKRLRGGDHVQRWAAARLLEPQKRFRRINGYRALPSLVEALKKRLTTSRRWLRI